MNNRFTGDVSNGVNAGLLFDGRFQDSINKLKTIVKERFDKDLVITENFNDQGINDVELNIDQEVKPYVQAIVKNAAEMSLAEKEEIAQLVDVVLQGLVANWVRLNDIFRLEENYSLHQQEETDLENDNTVVLFRSKLGKEFEQECASYNEELSLPTTSDGRISYLFQKPQLYSRIFFLQGSDNELRRRTALAIHDLVQSQAFVRWTDLDIKNVDDFADLTSATIYAGDYDQMNENDRGILEQEALINRGFPRPLLIISSELSAAELVAKNLISDSFAKMLENVTLKLDAIPLDKIPLDSVVDMFVHECTTTYFC